MSLEVMGILHSVIRETGLPNREPRMQLKREPALYELNASFQRQRVRGRDQNVEMVWHDNECMKEELGLFSAHIEHVDE